MTLEALAPELGLFVLQTSRVGGLIAAAPLPWKEAPVKLRAGLVLTLAFLAHGMPGASPLEPLNATRTLLAVPTEVLVGVAMGLVVRIAFSAADVAADAVGPLIGLAVPSVFDPLTLSSATVLSRIFGLLMALLAVLVGVHRIVISSVLASFRVLPAGSAIDPSLATFPLLKMVVSTLVLGLRLALPLAAVLLMTQVALAFLSRAAPAMQIFSIGFAVSLVVGAGILMVSLPDVASGMAADLSSIGFRIEVVVAALMGR
ncbi:MAG: flagellar biosynthetic protein FliR [Deltaproteobacteria bacterium]|nr:flagellar biosynthetic protein FliR [Deltaproteobacteria bacterium]